MEHQASASLRTWTALQTHPSPAQMAAMSEARVPGAHPRWTLSRASPLPLLPGSRSQSEVRLRSRSPLPAVGACCLPLHPAPAARPRTEGPYVQEPPSMPACHPSHPCEPCWRPAAAARPCLEAHGSPHPSVKDLPEKGREDPQHLPPPTHSPPQQTTPARAGIAGNLCPLPAISDHGP